MSRSPPDGVSCFLSRWEPTPILGEGVRNNLPSSFPVLLSWPENEPPLPAEIFSSFAFRRSWQGFFWAESRRPCCAGKRQAPSRPRSDRFAETPRAVLGCEAGGAVVRGRRMFSLLVHLRPLSATIWCGWFRQGPLPRKTESCLLL